MPRAADQWRALGGRVRRAFSLVELLVVIGIIAILIAFLLPVLSRVQASARAVQCASNLRSLGQALFMYGSENGGSLPAWSGWHVAGGDGSGDDAPGPGWTEQLETYYVSPLNRVYDCPSFPPDYPINYFLEARYSAVNNRHTITFGQISRASEYVLSGDCTQEMLYPSWFGTASSTHDDCDKDDATQEAIVFANQYGGRNMHPGGNNVLFADGHVTLMRRFDRSYMTYHPRKSQSWSEVTAEAN